MQKQKPLKQTLGFTLIEVMIAASVAFVIIGGVSVTLQNLFKSTTSVNRLSDLTTLKATIRDSINCQQTLGVALPTTVPCNGSLYQLKRASGTNIGPIFTLPGGIVWLATASCPIGANNLLIQFQLQNVAPGQKMANGLRTDKFDLFDGTSDFCRAYFTGAIPCAVGQTLIGYAGAVPICGIQNLSGTFCGIGVNNACNGGGWTPGNTTETVLCHGFDPKNGCPTGYTQRTFANDVRGAGRNNSCTYTCIVN